MNKKQVILKTNKDLFKPFVELESINVGRSITVFRKSVKREIKKICDDFRINWDVCISFKNVSSKVDPNWDLNKEFVNCDSDSTVWSAENLDGGYDDNFDDYDNHFTYRLEEIIDKAINTAWKNIGECVVLSNKMTAIRENVVVENGWVVFYINPDGTTDMCPLCGEYHRHGTIGGYGGGHRSAHCRNGHFVSMTLTEDYLKEHGIKDNHGYLLIDKQGTHGN